MSDSMSSFNKNNFITTKMTFTTNLQDEHEKNNNLQQHHYHHYQQQQYEQKQQQQSRQKIMALNDYYFFETTTTTTTNTTMNANECNLHPLRIFPTTGSSSNPNNTCTTHTTTAKPSPIIVYQTNLNNNNDSLNHNNHNSHHNHNHNHLAYTNDESFALRSALKQHFLQKQKQKNLSNNNRINNNGYTLQEDFQTNRNWNENNDNIKEIHHQDSQTTKMYNFSFHPVSTTTTSTTNIDASNNTNSVGKTFTDTNNIYQSRNTFCGNLNQVLTEALDLICDTDGVENNNNNNNNVSFDNDDNDDNISMISEMTINEHTNCMMEPNHVVMVPEKYKIPVVSTTTVDASTPNSQDIAVLTNNKEDGDDQDDDFTVNTALFDDDLPTIAYNYNAHQPHGTSNIDVNNKRPTVSSHHPLGMSNTDVNNKHHVASTKPSTSSSVLSITGNMKRLKVYMERSRITQEMLQDWDEKNGLPRSHSVTMFRTNRSRTQLLENRILPKWNGKPLIGNEPIQKKIIKNKKKNSNNNKIYIKKKKHSTTKYNEKLENKQTNK